MNEHYFDAGIFKFLAFAIRYFYAFLWFGINISMSNKFNIETTTKSDAQVRFRSEIENWVLRYEPLFTHAVTLTFNLPKARHILMNIDPCLTLNAPDMIELYKANMRTFKWKLVKALYGNAYKRYNKPVVFIPILEGLGRDEGPHYHCILGVERNRHEKLYQEINTIWRQMPLGGNRIDIQPYTSSGWTRYSTKNALFANRESIDWENVLLPQQSLAE